MVIWFNNVIARKQLIEHGVVYTFRTSRRTVGYQNAFYNDRENDIKMVKIGRVEIVKIAEWVDINESIERFLSNYVSLSGFNTVGEWVEAIISFIHNRRLPEYGILFKVTLKDKDYIRLNEGN